MYRTYMVNNKPDSSVLLLIQSGVSPPWRASCHFCQDMSEICETVFRRHMMAYDSVWWLPTWGSTIVCYQCFFCNSKSSQHYFFVTHFLLQLSDFVLIFGSFWHSSLSCGNFLLSKVRMTTEEIDIKLNTTRLFRLSKSLISLSC